MFIRPYQTADAEAIAAIYRDAVINTGATAYDAEQIKAWAAYPEDVEELRRSLQQGLTLVAVANEQLVAFGQLHPRNHIAFLYTASSCARQGYAAQIYQQLETEAIQQGVTQLQTAASRISKSFFLKMGYHLIEPEIVTRQGIEIERFKMAKTLSPL